METFIAIVLILIWLAILITIIIGMYLFIKDEVSIKDKFTIEYYPITKRYYPKYNEYYMKKDYLTGVWKEMKPFLFMFSDWGNTEEQAKEMIAEFSEHVLKNKVVVMEVITVDEE